MPRSDIENNVAYAHSLNGEPIERWERLEEHLQKVAERAAEFCEAFGAADLGRLAGLWHDVGKIQPDFQRYIRGDISCGPPHAWVGAMFALVQNSQLGVPIAAAITAHHGALPDIKPDAANGILAGSTLIDRLQIWKQEIRALKHLLPSRCSIPALPKFVVDGKPDLCKYELFIRFLFSALIDAAAPRRRNFIRALSRY
jgi:CRISPR-associated endonuclease/helicase Cas3